MTCFRTKAQTDAYTEFRIAVIDQSYVITGEEDLDRRTRERFFVLPRVEREKVIAWWEQRLRDCLARGYWTLLEDATRSYVRLRGAHESSQVREDSATNSDAMRRRGALPAKLPTGTRMLFGELHGRPLPSEAELLECEMPIGPSYLSPFEKTQRYFYTREDGTRGSAPPEYVDWLAFK